MRSRPVWLLICPDLCWLASSPTEIELANPIDCISVSIVDEPA